MTRNPPPINAGPDGLNEVASLIQNPPWLARQSRPRLEGISNDVSDSQDNPVDEDYLPTGAEPKFRVPNRGRKIDPNSPAYRSRRHVCEQCDERFERSEHLLRHINTIHLKKREYICDLCIPNKTFSRSDNLLQHKAQKHKLGKARNRRVSKKIKVEDEEDSHGEISVSKRHQEEESRKQIRSGKKRREECRIEYLLIASPGRRSSRFYNRTQWIPI